MEVSWCLALSRVIQKAKTNATYAKLDAQDAGFRAGRRLTAKECGDVGEGVGPVVPGRLRVVAEGLDVEADGVALLCGSEVREGGTEDKLEHCVWMLEGGGAVGDAVEELFVSVARNEDGAVAGEEVDVAG